MARTASVKKVQEKGQSLALKHRPAVRAEDGDLRSFERNVGCFRESICHWPNPSVTESVTEMPVTRMVGGLLQSLICHFGKIKNGGRT